MAYAHVAHDCRVGNRVIIANGTSLAGHIQIEDCAILGGLSGVHQFVRIGTHAMIGGLSGASKDVPPFTMAVGQRAVLHGLNLNGLRRHGFSPEVISELKAAYRILFRSGLTKIDSWDSTLFLFNDVYAVPVLPPALAAWLATAAELVLPVLLVVGLATRLGALGLFVLNYVAVISFPDMGAVGIKDHVLWGVMLAMIFFHGPGRLSVDQWLSRRAALR